MNKNINMLSGVCNNIPKGCISDSFPENEIPGDLSLSQLLCQANMQIKSMELLFAEQEKKINELEELAVNDPVTGFLNARGMEIFFSKEQARIKRGHSTGGVLISFSFDNFQDI